MIGNKPIGRRSAATRWAIGLLLLSVLALLRLPWIEADGGNSTFWSYAYFSYDEACYTSGGRLAYLTGKFLDPQVSEPTTFGSGWGMHFLAYLGYRGDGLTLGAMRWPSMIMAIIGWFSIYVATSRRTLPALAGVVVGVLSSNPATLTYERTASTDVVVGACAAMGFALCTAHVTAFSVIAGGLMALACCVKANAVVLMPIVTLGLLIQRHHRRKRIALFILGFGMAMVLLWLGRQAALEAASDSRGIEWVLSQCARWQYSLLDLGYSPAAWLRPLSVFPRWQGSFMLGPFLLWCIALPAAWILILGFNRSQWTFRALAIPVGMTIYAGALASQPNNAMRHYLPLLFFAPFVLIAARHAFHGGRVSRASSLWLAKIDSTGHRLEARDTLSSFRTNRANWVVVVASLVAIFCLYWFQTDRGWSEAKVQQIVYNEVTVPNAAWQFITGRVAIAWLIGVIALRHVRLRRFARIAIALVLVWLFFANYTISLLNIDRTFVFNQLLLQASVVLAGFLLVTWSTVRRWKIWYFTHALVVLIFCFANTYWRQAYRELATPTYHTLAASRELTSALPQDAMVIGRRASTLLRNTSHRVGLGGFHFSAVEFVEAVEQLLREGPQRPLYWLVDGDDDLQWDWYKQHGRDRWTVIYVGSVSIPSGDLLRLRQVEEALPMIPIHLFRIQLIATD